MVELNKIYNEDCHQTMKRISDKQINIVLTSPPYNMTPRKGGNGDSGRYDVYVDFMQESEYLYFTSGVFLELHRILKDDGVVLYNFGYSIENPALPYKVVNEIVNSNNFTLVDTICWKKLSGLPFPANKHRLSRNWEFVWVFVKQGMENDFFIDREIVKTSEKTGQNYYRLDYNFIESPNNDGKTNEINQATFSSELVCRLLDIYCGNEMVVYDPFMGYWYYCYRMLKITQTPILYR